MSVRVAGPARFEVENLEERRLLSGVGDAVAWDLKTPISGEISEAGEVDYFKFTATAGQKIVFDSTGMKQFAILDSDGASELDHLLILDGQTISPTLGRLVFVAPHSGTFYVSVTGYLQFLVESDTGPYSLAAYAINVQDGGSILAGQTASGSFGSAGEVDSYTFDAKAGTIYRFEVTSEKLPDGVSLDSHFVMGVEEARPWLPATSMPEDAQEAYPGHNIQILNIDGQKGLKGFAEWVAPASGTYHFSIAPLDAAHAGSYTLVMSQRAFPCDPQEAATSQNIQPTTSLAAARHRKSKLHHRRPAVHKHAKPSAKAHSQSARQKLLSLARD